MKKDEFQSIKAIKMDSEIVYGRLLQNKFKVQKVGDPRLDEKRLSIGAKTGIYAIFINDKTAYIGKTKSLINRWREHFIKKSDSTHSKIDKLKEIFENKTNNVEVSFVEVPAEIYSAIEECLMSKVDDSFKWNTRSS